MDPNAAPVQTPLPVEHPGVCPVCHQPVASTYYFCPNCGAKIHEPPLSTAPLTQLGIYAFSIVLPMICYLAITKWPGLKYLRSQDEDTRTVGVIACALLIISSVLTFYYGYIWTEEAIQQTTAQVNQELGSSGY